MNFLVNNEQMKKAEADCNGRFISYSEMMENVGRAVAGKIRLLSRKKVTILCGAGNNGGDGFAIASYLEGADVILLCGEPKSDISREKLSRVSGERVFDYSENKEKCREIVKNSELVVDCVFGTGFHGELPEAAAELFGIAVQCPDRISVDIPSGADSDTGCFDERCFRPRKTFVLAAYKKCMLIPECRDVFGEAELVDIGIPECCFKEYLAVLTDESSADCLPERRPTSHKGTFGRLLNIAGSVRYSGAAAMSTRAALRTGAGLTTLATVGSVVSALCGSLVENTFLPLPETNDGFIGEGAEIEISEFIGKMTAVSVGCGMGNSKITQNITEYVIRNADCGIIIDADGINSIAKNINVLKERTGPTIITPHPAEFSRISGLSVEEIQKDRLDSAAGFAEEYGVIVVLKGANTIITDGKRTVVNTSGSPALAKGGSGDVLCGVIAALLAQGAEPFSAASGGVYVHGRAGELAAEKMPAACVLASDVIEMLPKAFAASSNTILE